MPELNYSIPRPKLPLIFLIEKFCEEKEKIIEIIRSILCDINDDNPDYSAVISFYEYGNNYINKTQNKSIGEINFSEFSENTNDKLPEDNIDISLLLEELCNDMSKNVLFCDIPYKLPIVIIIGNGSAKYFCSETSVTDIMNNNWFRGSKKFMISFNDVSSKTMDLLKTLGIWGYEDIFIIDDKTKIEGLCEYVLAKELYAEHNYSSIVFANEEDETSFYEILRLNNPEEVDPLTEDSDQLTG